MPNQTKNANPDEQQPPAVDPHSYDFILQKPAPVKKRFGNSQAQRIAVIAIIGGIILITGLVLWAVLSSDGGKSNFQTSVAVQQAKLLQIANRGVKDGVSTNARGFASTVKLTVESDNKDLLATVSKSTKKKIDNQSKVVDTQVDAKLTKAEQNNHFDEEMFNVLKDELSVYQQNARAAYDGTSETRLKALYGLIFTHAGQLIKQLPVTTNQ